ncbi:MAG: Oxidoreductase, short chain dehydrogenase/reductase family protein [Verrucomicrobiaceae bacterium]|nr:Oxidoreductase, short chain dehydrogenase/reductase family protein [Verrucomicrobiaceae bacterium]
MVQRVFITAGASGIGREIARAFAAQGANVFVCDIDASGLDNLAAEIPGLATQVCDVSKLADIEKTVAFAADTLGGIDVVVNNAGIAGPTAPVEEVTPEQWDKVIQINLSATFHVTRLAIPYLKKSSAGAIVTISSAAGRFGYANRSAYSSSKWALVGFTKTLAIELGQYGIRANVILPGTVEGERIQKVFEGRAQISGQTVEEVKLASLANQSIKQLIDPRDIAALAVFLASDHGKSISGQMLPIDGDMHQL